jgi:tRNA/tmRNA/rRNA uracil-C5-methylase (TrmA/RlmC/RlmD family)
VVDDNDPLLPLEEVLNNSNESRKRTSVEDTSSRKKARTKKRSKGASPMLKKLIEELKTLPSSVEDNSESQPEVQGSFTDLNEAIIQAEGRTVTNNHEIIRAYYSFGKELENRLTFYKITHSERRAQRKLNDEVGEQLPNDLSQNAIEKRVERARKIYDLFSGIGVDKIQRVSYSALRISKLDWDEIDTIKEAFE